jgi:hypothetical protein
VPLHLAWSFFIPLPKITICYTKTMESNKNIESLKLFGERLQGKYTIPVLVLISRGANNNKHISDTLCISKQHANEILRRLLSVHLIEKNNGLYRISTDIKQFTDIMFLAFRNITYTQKIHPFALRNPNTNYSYIDKGV